MSYGLMASVLPILLSLAGAKPRVVHWTARCADESAGIGQVARKIVTGRRAARFRILQYNHE